MSFLRSIVVAEDEDADVTMLRRAFERAQVTAPVHYARDGFEAIQQLEQTQGEPVLLLLDLKMPRLDGFEVLQWLNSTQLSKNVSVVVLSSSGDSADIKKAGALGANAYIVKPSDPCELERVIGRLNDSWLSHVPDFQEQESAVAA